MNSPDNHARGFLAEAPRADRYETSSSEPGDVAAKLSSLIPHGVKLLDVGCGSGSVSEIIVKMTGVQLTGIEPDPDRAKAAQARGLNVFQGFLNEEFLKEHGPFDVIVFADVIEHLPDPSEVVRIAKTGLSPGGSIVVSVPNVAHYFVRMDLLRGKFDYDDCGIMDATHLRWFTRRTICNFFERLGFRVTAVDCTVSAGLPDYRQRRPWNWMNEARRRRFIAGLVKRWPTIFGVQHVIRATLPGGAELGGNKRV